MSRRSINAIIGPQGCGKGTNAKRLATHIEAEHVEMSTLLRERAAVDDALGHYIKTTMDAGELVKSEVVIEVLIGAMDRFGWGRIILDGFPRQLEQAEIIVELATRGYEVNVAIFELPDEICLKRLVVRLKEFEDEQKACAERGEPPLTPRKDDETIEGRKKRLRQYRENELIINPYLEKHLGNRVHYIPAHGNKDEVFATLVGALRLREHIFMN